MRIEHEKIGFSFEIADRITVREQMHYRSATAGVLESDEKYVTLWRAALPLITAWQAALVPEPDKLDLDKVYDPAVANLVMEVGAAVWLHMRKLEDLPKNS